jgi:hypothetical protein
MVVRYFREEDIVKKSVLWARWIALTPIRIAHGAYLGLSNFPLEEAGTTGLRPYWLHRSPNDQRPSRVSR